MKHNSRMGVHRQLALGIVDFGLAMGLIWIISLGTTAYHGEAFVLFSLGVATVAALDLAILRHLRRAYASPRRGLGRRT